MGQIPIIIKQRDILLLPFPFSDLTEKKVRPALVLSSNNYNDNSRDIIVCGITSNIDHDFYSVKIENEDLEDGRLFNPSCVKSENVLRIEKELCIKKIGKLDEKTFSLVLDKFISIFK